MERKKTVQELVFPQVVVPAAGGSGGGIGGLEQAFEKEHAPRPQALTQPGEEPAVHVEDVDDQVVSLPQDVEEIEIGADRSDARVFPREAGKPLLGDIHGVDREPLVGEEERVSAVAGRHVQRAAARREGEKLPDDLRRFAGVVLLAVLLVPVDAVREQVGLHRVENFRPLNGPNPHRFSPTGRRFFSGPLTCAADGGRLPVPYGHPLRLVAADRYGNSRVDDVEFVPLVFSKHKAPMPELVPSVQVRGRLPASRAARRIASIIDCGFARPSPAFPKAVP